jgi:hypothetical protein
VSDENSNGMNKGRRILPALITIEPMDVKRAGVAGTDLPALAGAGCRRGAAVGWDFADRQCFTAVLDGGVGVGNVHGRWGGRVGGDGQGEASGRAAIGAWRGGFDALLTNC